MRSGRKHYVNAATIAILVFAGLWLVQSSVNFTEIDARAYHGVELTPDLYSGNVGDRTFLYPPPAAVVFAAFGGLPWPLFYGLLTAANLAALYWMLGPLAAPALLLPWVNRELATGNVHLLLAAAVVLAVRHPEAWAAPALVKVTPAIGALWQPRTAWRPAVICLSAVAVTGLLLPGMWVAWFGMMLDAPMGYASSSVGLAWPLPVRMLMAAALIAGARWRPALLPVATMLALPVVWAQAFCMLVACWPLSRRTPFAARTPRSRWSLERLRGRIPAPSP